MNTIPESRRRWLAHPWLSLVIGVCWLLLQGSITVANVLWAAVLGIGLPWLVHGFLGPGARVRRPGAAVRLALVVLWDIVRANVAVAALVLDPRRAPRPAWVEVAHGLQAPQAVALLATIITTTPGTVSCVVDEERGVILVHALDAPDPQAVIDEILLRYARPLKEILE